MKRIWLILLITIASLALFSYQITEIPPGINGDEASIGNNAVLLARTGRVEAGNRFPLFIPTVSDWKQPVTFYLTAAAFKFFGPSYEALRGVSVFLALVSMVLLFFLTKELLGFGAGIVALLLFALTPIILIQSHLALENIAVVPFTLLWLWLLTLYRKKKDTKYLVFAGMALGAGTFSYYGMRLIVPVLALSTAIYLRKLRPALLFLAGTTPFILLLVWAYFRYPGAVFGNNSFTPPDSYQRFFLPYLSIFDPSFLFLKGDATIYHSTGTTGMFLLAGFPLFILGAVRAMKEKNNFYRFLLTCFFLAPVLYVFIGESYRASRLLVLIPFYLLISSLGFVSLATLRPKVLRLLTIAGLFILIALNWANFAKDYWYSYPQRARESFSHPWHSIYKILDEKSKQGYQIYLLEDMAAKTQEIKFFQAVYPFAFTEWRRGEKIPSKSALLTYPDLLTSEERIIFKEIYTNRFSQTIFLKE